MKLLIILLLLLFMRMKQQANGCRIRISEYS
ncbi:MAG TPA: hypothetical protein [Caudoviricetes sp.]|nr:MAG TPA: hypothetical protein [Caudoviricetes sp.]